MLHPWREIKLKSIPLNWGLEIRKLAAQDFHRVNEERQGLPQDSWDAWLFPWACYCLLTQQWVIPHSKEKPILSMSGLWPEVWVGWWRPEIPSSILFPHGLFFSFPRHPVLWSRDCFQTTEGNGNDEFSAPSKWHTICLISISFRKALSAPSEISHWACWLVTSDD